MKDRKKKRIIETVMCCILACALLVGAYFIQLHLPMFNVPEDAFTIHRVCRFKTNEGHKLFLMYSGNIYGGSAVKWKDADNKTLVISYKKPLITTKSENTYLNCLVLDFKSSAGSYENVKIGSQTIWSLEADANAAVPAYVYAYDSFGTPEGPSSWTENEDEGWLMAEYPDGSMTKWTFDGTVLFDNHSTSN